jgi:hypothetical protein
MSRNSIIVLSTAILLAATATGAFARRGGGGGGEHFAGSSTFTSEFASHAVHHQAVREAHRLTSIASHPIGVIGVAQKKPTAKDDPDPPACGEPGSDCIPITDDDLDSPDGWGPATTDSGGDMTTGGTMTTGTNGEPSR